MKVRVKVHVSVGIRVKVKVKVAKGPLRSTDQLYLLERGPDAPWLARRAFLC